MPFHFIRITIVFCITCKIHIWTTACHLYKQNSFLSLTSHKRVPVLFVKAYTDTIHLVLTKLPLEMKNHSKENCKFRVLKWMTSSKMVSVNQITSSTKSLYCKHNWSAWYPFTKTGYASYVTFLNLTNF